MLVDTKDIESSGSAAPVAKQDKPAKRTVKRKGAAEATPALPEGDDPDIEQAVQPRSRALVVVEHLERDGDVFPGANAVTYVQINGVTMDLRDGPFESYAINWARKTLGTILAEQDLKDVKRALTATASEKPRRRVHTRRGPGPDGGMYLDLSQVGNSRAVEVARGGGWRIVPKPVGCDFVRPTAQLPLPDPVPGGDISDLWKGINVSHAKRPLVLGWLLAALCPWLESQMMLTFSGRSKAGKSNASLSLRNLIDPSDGDLLPPPQNAENLAIDAEGALVLALDNLSGMPDWMSNSLCRTTTGQVFSNRQRYADRRRVLMRFTVPIIANGIEDVAEKDDLLNRSLVVELDPIPQEKRLSPRQIRKAMEKILPSILGCLLDALAAGMTGLDGEEDASKALTRDPDFDRLIAAAEPSLGLEPGAFARAFASMEAGGLEVSLNANPVYKPLAEFLSLQRQKREAEVRSAARRANLQSASSCLNGSPWSPAPEPAPASVPTSREPLELWSGSATDLHNHLTTDQTRWTKKWPSQPNHLSGWVKRLAEAMEAQDGIETRFTDKTDGVGKRITFLVK